VLLGWLMGNPLGPPNFNADKDLRALATQLCVADCVATALPLQAAVARKRPGRRAREGEGKWRTGRGRTPCGSLSARFASL
jgi:hypothetical protein